MPHLNFNLKRADKMPKRKRDPVFSSSERQVLLDMIERYYSIVSLKKTDTATMKKKAAGWVKITTEFNACSGIYPRDASVLKNCWENLKKRAKQLTVQKHFLESGEPLKQESTDPIISRVLQLIYTGRDSVKKYDSEGNIIFSSNCSQEDPLSHVDEVDVESEGNSSLSGSVDWEVPVQLGPRPNTTKEVHRDTTSHTNGQTVASDQIKNLTMTVHSEEAHEIKMRILALQEEKQIEMLKQEKLKTQQEEIKLRILETYLKISSNDK